MTLYLLPNSLGNIFYPSNIAEVVATLDGLISESPQSGRSFLGKFRTKKPPYDIPLALLNEHTRPDEIDFFLQPIKDGQNWGLISDCGLTCLADPGATLVFRARQLGIEVVTYPGPSSIIMAIQLSGLPAQRFGFNGYLSKVEEKLKLELKVLERRSFEEKSLQLFIEAPYRNKHTLETVVSTLNPETYVFIATDLGLETQKTLLRKVEALRKSPLPNIEKAPTVFAIMQQT